MMRARSQGRLDEVTTGEHLDRTSPVCHALRVRQLDGDSASGPMWAGVLGPVLFVGVFLLEGAVRPGYDPIRMQVSYLSLGDRGAIQVASFLATAGLLEVFAVRLRARWRSAGGPGARGVPIAIGITGLGLLIAGLFSTMPAFGYPPGTPDAFPADIPPTAYLHVLGAFLFFGGMIAGPAIMTRRFRASGATGWAVYSAATTLVVAFAFAASSADGNGRPFVPAAAGLLQRIAIVAGLAWIAGLAALAPLGAERVADERISSP
jgi:hypothetical protein